MVVSDVPVHVQCWSAAFAWQSQSWTAAPLAVEAPLRAMSGEDRPPAPNGSEGWHHLSVVVR